MGDGVMVNFNGLVRQYGPMGIKALIAIHDSKWHQNFFADQYKKLTQ